MYEQPDSIQSIESGSLQGPGLAGQSIFVVANPRAAHGDVGRRWPQILAQLQAALGPVAFAHTDAPQAATGLTRKALRAGHDVILSLGGDGTHNEVVNGFFENGAPINPKAALGLLPCGTGGDLRKTLGLSGDMNQAIERIMAGVRTPCDVGHIQYISNTGALAERHFINIASFGISGLVDVKVNNSSKALGGKASFMLGVIKALAEYTPQDVHMVIDDHIDVQVNINTVAIANGRYFGGGMMVAPHARLTDGMFDIVIIRPLELSQMLRHSVKLYEGRHLESPHVSHLQARKIYAEPLRDGEDILLDVDGEAPGRLPATFELIPSGINLL